MKKNWEQREGDLRQHLGELKDDNDRQQKLISQVTGSRGKGI